MTTLKTNLLLLLLVGLVACGTTAQIKHSYINPTASEKDLNGVMIIGVATTNAARIDFEKAFVRDLKGRGVRAMASYTLVPGDDVTAEQAIAAANDNNLDTILVTRYVGVAPVYGPRRGGLSGYYGHAYEVAYEPPVYTTNVTVVLVSDLYEVSTEEHLWQVVSEAIKADGKKQLRDAFIAAFVDDLRAQKLLP